ncbi:MAG: hypothetical protein ACOZQL_11170 [Myxococcota bacterium]
MRRAVLSGGLIALVWMVTDLLAHRWLLAPLYAEAPALWRPPGELDPALVIALTVLLAAVYVVIYGLLVRPKTLMAGLALGGLLGVAFGASSGFGTFVHSPIPLALAWGWFGLGALKGLLAGVVLAFGMRPRGGVSSTA